VNGLRKFIALLATGLVAGGSNAQGGGTQTDAWLESSRPLIGMQLCEDPRAPFRVAFDGTTEECKAEVERLFVKCTTDVPNVRLPPILETVEDVKAAGVLIYECVASYYVGGTTLAEFNRRYPLEPPPEAE
jgi:hypothetical protein